MGCLLGKLTADVGHTAAAAAAAAPPEPLRPPQPAEPVLRGGSVRVLSSRKDAWPDWLSAAAGDALAGLTPCRADSFQMLEKIGSGTYSNVYKARDVVTGRLVALKKVRVERGEGAAEGAQFMVREIALLRRLDHPNVIRLEGLATSRLPSSPSLYLVFEYMEHDLAGLTAASGVSFSEPQIKCYMRQLLSGLEHCHSRGVLHRDIKCANLLINREGILKIADFGLATSFDPKDRQPMTSRVVTLWYRPPELLLGATHYGVGVDLWSAGCILAELLTGKPILPGRTEVEQLHKIFKLCGSPSEDYVKKLKLAQMTTTNFGKYKSRISETFEDLPPPSVSLIKKLLSLDPVERGTATASLHSEFFTTEPYACEPSSLPQYPPSKEMDAKLRADIVRRQRRLNAVEDNEATKFVRARNSSYREVRDLVKDDKLQTYVDRRRLMTSSSVSSQNERFPPPHLDAAIGYSLETSKAEMKSFPRTNSSLSSSIVGPEKATLSTSSSSMDHHVTGNASTWKNRSREHHQVVPSNILIGAFKPILIGGLTDFRRTRRAPLKARTRGSTAVGAVK